MHQMTNQEMDLPSRMERFLLSLPTNPYPVSEDEKQEILFYLRKIKQRPERPGMSTASQVGMVITWSVGPQMARQIGLDAMKAGVLDEDERERFNLGIVAATFFPPPPFRKPTPLVELERYAERALGFSRPRWTR